MDNDKIIMLCSLSLSRISNDLKNIDNTASEVCLALAHQLALRIEEVPEALIHNVDTITPHDTSIGDEINAIANEIQNAGGQDESV